MQGEFETSGYVGWLLEAEPARPRLDERGYWRGRMFAAVARLVQAVVIFAAALDAAGIMSQW